MTYALQQLTACICQATMSARHYPAGKAIHIPLLQGHDDLHCTHKTDALAHATPVPNALRPQHSGVFKRRLHLHCGTRLAWCNRPPHYDHLTSTMQAHGVRRCQAVLHSVRPARFPLFPYLTVLAGFA
jgi:hypothetical protein